MPEQVISPTAPPVVATTNGTQQDQYFGAEMEADLAKAFATVRPDEFKPKPAIAPAREAQLLKAEEVYSDADAPKAIDRTPGAPEVKPPAKAAQWKEVNEERARLKEENAKFKAEQEKYAKEQEKWKSWETERNEFETIKKHNAELLDRMQQIAVEKDPRFENYFKAKTDTAIALARQAVGDSHAERVSKLLQLPDSDWRTEQLEAVMAELGPTRQSRLGSAIVEMDRIALERSTAISKSKENWEAMQKADRDNKANQKQQFERTFQDRLQKWSDPEKGLALFQKKDGDETHNAEVQKRIEHARNILNMNLSADEFSKAALWASAAPGLLQDLLASREREKQKDAELEALKAGGPELQGSGQESTVDDDKQYEGMSAGEIIALKAKQAGGWQ